MAPAAKVKRDGLRIEYQAVNAVAKAIRNPKKHGLEDIKLSMMRFGFVSPAILNETTGRLVAGHGRIEALAEMMAAKDTPPARIRVHNGQWLLPVVRGVGFATDAEAEAYLLADNKLVELGGYDDRILAEMIRDLSDLDAGLAGLGISDGEATRLMDGLLLEGSGGPDADAVPEKVASRSKPGDLWLLGDHRLLCGDSTKATDVARLMGDDKARLMNTDPPYGVDYAKVKDGIPGSGFRDIRERSGDIANDTLTSGPELQAFLEAAIRTALPHLIEGCAFYLWHPMLTQGTFFAAAAAAAADILIHRQIVWVKPNMVLTRSGQYHWKHELCQPPGTMVRVATGKHGARRDVPIETLRDGDKVVSYNKYSSQVEGFRDGRRVRVGTRDYDGNMYTVSAGGKSSRCTDGHRWTTKLSPRSAEMWCVYLMRRGDWWRVGKSQILAPYGCGVKWRAKTEGADATWILSAHNSSLDALCAEQVASVKYGIPTTHWRVPEHGNTRNRDQIRSIYEQLDLVAMNRGAMRALSDHGRCLEYPFVARSMYRTKYSRRASMQVRACNLLPGAMLLPIPQDEGDSVDWSELSGLSWSHYSGPVFSLDVDGLGHYIADGIVTHNCFYGWVRGKPCPWYGDKSQVSVWEIGREGTANEREDHPTQKPVELFEIPMRNHTKQGDAVYEPFSGSGSQIIAAERLGRRCMAMELEPRYVDVAIARWETFTGKTASLAGTADKARSARKAAHRLKSEGIAK